MSVAVLSIALVVLLGLAPLWHAAAARGLGWWRVACAALAALVVAATVWGGRALEGRVPAPVPDDRPLADAGRDEGFVTSDACRKCHPRETATWQASFHRTMTQPATPATVIPVIDDEPFVHDGDRLRLVRRGDRYFAGIAAGAARDGTLRWIEREIVQTTGSHHFQAFWFANGHGRELTMFPYCYRIDAGTWMPVDAAFLMPPDTRQPLGGARWNTNCVSCHTTAAEPRVDEPGVVDTRMAEFGIACEACHGPAATHVATQADPVHRYTAHLGDGVDTTIANPTAMSPERSAEVCGQCHGVTIARAERQAEWARRGHVYRPGDVLQDTRVLVSRENADAPELRATLARQPDFFDTIFWPDGQVRIAGRDYHGLVASPCYVDGEGSRKLTCLSCHRLHPDETDPASLAAWADDQLKPGMRGDLACTQCHTELESDAQKRAHARHAPDVVGCQDCHMPYTTYGLLKTIRSHTITSPSVRESVESGRPNACNLCHLDRTLGWTAERLAADFGIAAPDLGADERNIAAGVLWSLRGDAGQRALVAAALGRPAVQHAAGTDWTGPFVAELLRDPYHAVRFVAMRGAPAALGSLGGYDFMAPATERDAVVDRLLRDWRSAAVGRRGADRSRVLLGIDGQLRGDEFRRLLAGRDLRRVYLGE